MKEDIKMNRLNQNLLNIGGFDVETASECPKKTWLVLSQYSSMLFIPVFVGLFTAGYAASVITGSLLGGVIGGILYALIVFTIDRGILSTGRSTTFSFGMAIRVGMAILLSTLAAEPLVLYVFSDTIAEEQYRQEQSDVKPLEDKYAAKYNDLDNKIASSSNRLKELQLAYTQELDGTGGSGKKNKGPIYKQKYQDHLDAKVSHTQLLDQVIGEKARLGSSYDRDLTRLRNAQATSLAGRLDTLHEVKSMTVHIGVWILRLALILIELAPLMIKLKKSDSWEVYWDLIKSKNDERRQVHSNNSNLRVARLDLEEKLKHEREMQVICFEDEGLKRKQKEEILKSKLDLALSSSDLKVDYIKKAMIKYQDNDRVREDLLDELEIINADFKKELETK